MDHLYDYSHLIHLNLQLPSVPGWTVFPTPHSVAAPLSPVTAKLSRSPPGYTILLLCLPACEYCSDIEAD